MFGNTQVDTSKINILLKARGKTCYFTFSQEIYIHDNSIFILYIFQTSFIIVIFVAYEVKSYCTVNSKQLLLQLVDAEEKALLFSCI